MIQEFVDRFMENKDALRAKFEASFPGEYKDIVKAVVEIITSDEYTTHDIDPGRIHEIDDGHYQGTLLYVIAEKGYQPSDYYYVKVDYGSCSGCDTLQAIESEHYFATDKKQPIDDLMTLALHIVQGLKMIRDEAIEDAYLIAAAPELYKALEEMLSYSGIIEERDSNCATNKARVALAKARGEV